MFLTQKVLTMGTKQRQVTNHRRTIQICPNKTLLWRTQGMSVSLGFGRAALGGRGRGLPILALQQPCFPCHWGVWLHLGALPHAARFP